MTSYTVDDLFNGNTAGSFGGPVFSPPPSAQSSFNDGVGAQAVNVGDPGTGVAFSGRTVPLADATTITPNASSATINTFVSTQSAGTLTVNAPLGAPLDNQKLMLRIKTSAAQTYSWNAIYRGGTTITLPTATSGSSNYDYLGFIYNAGDAKWDLVATVSNY